MIDKQLIIQRFTKSLKTYNKEAVIQKNIINRLVRDIKDLNLDNKVSKVLEIGCGTGLLTNNLIELFNPNYLLLNDICEGVKNYYNKILFEKFNINVDFIIGDAEKLNFGNYIDVIISTSTIQWVENLPNFFQKCYNALSENGLLILTTFGKTHFKEFRHLIETDTLVYRNINELKDMLDKKFHISLIKEDIYTLYFDMPLDVLLHCKKTGVNAYNNKMWLKSDIFNFFKLYDYKFNDKVLLTYHPIFIIAKKKR